jgi:hypothetical protein
MKKNDLDKLFKKYQPVVEKTGKQLAKAMKVAEKDISKMYKVAQTHVEIQMKNLQKEKLYHDLGKDVAGKLIKGEISIAGLEKYKKQLTKLSSEGEKMKRKLSRIGKEAPGKKKKTAKKK